MSLGAVSNNGVGCLGKKSWRIKVDARITDKKESLHMFRRRNSGKLFINEFGNCYNF